MPGAARRQQPLHPPVNVRYVVLQSRERGDLFVAGREMADRVGCARVAGQRERLATAAAEIDVAPRAASARLLHPRRAAEGVEGRRIRPNIGERVVAHRPEFKAGNGLGGVAGQHLARRHHGKIVIDAVVPDYYARLPKPCLGNRA